MIKNIQYTLALISLCPNLLWAQQRDTTAINEVIIHENRLQIPFNKATRNVQIIDKAAIRQLPVRSVAEVLAYVAGVDIRQRGPFGTQADVSIDGGSFEQTLILLNGVKISDVQTGHLSMNLPVSLDAVERIEVLRGPAARVYGVNALTGAINIITHASDKTSATVSLQSGSSFKKRSDEGKSGIYGGYGAQAVLNLPAGISRNLISLGTQRSNGQRYNSSTEDYKAFYQGKIQPNDRHGIDLMAGFIHNEFGANGFYAAPGDKESYEIVKTGLFSIGSTHKLGNNFQFKPRASYRLNKDDYRYYRDDISKARSQHETQVFALELNSSLHTSIGDFGFGLETRSEKIESTNIGDHDRYNHGLYAEYKTEPVRDLVVNIGTYVNYNTQYGWQVFPGIDAAYAFNDHWRASVNIGSSQRIPSFTDLFLKQPGNIGNAALKSERAWQLEGALKYHQQGFFVQGGYFRRNITDFIDWVRQDVTPAPPYQPFNLGSNLMQGLSFSAGQDVKIGSRSTLRYDLSYNYLKPKALELQEGKDSKYILESLRHQALARVALRSQNWNFTVGNRWIKRELNNAYLLTDVKAEYNLLKIGIFIDVNNIFNATYKEAGAVYLPSRWYTLGLRYAFL